MSSGDSAIGGGCMALYFGSAVMIFSTASRPAMRAATCGGRPRPAAPLGCLY
jgi:hypothetical protein